MNDESEVPDPIANFDQMQRGIVDVVKMIWTFYSAAMEQGFTEHQAFAMTMAYQHQLIS